MKEQMNTGQSDIVRCCIISEDVSQNASLLTALFGYGKKTCQDSPEGGRQDIYLIQNQI